MAKTSAGHAWCSGELVQLATIGVNYGLGDAMLYVCGMIVLDARMRAVPRNDGVRFTCGSSTPSDTCLADDQCVSAGTPHPDNACLICNSEGYEPSRGSCDDGNRCSTNDTCDDGVCRGTAPRACDDGLDCTIDGCGDITVNGYWKEVHSGASAGTWVNLADATYGGKIVTEQGKTRLDFTIKDGGIFDDDGKADGTISDPGGPGFMVQAAAPTCPFDPFRIDADKDGMTDAVELLRGSSSAVKNNDVFSHNDLFVDQLYRDFFGREGYGDAGSAYWLNAMSTGVMSRSDVLTTTLNSPEFDSHAGVVIRLYHATLGRSPELCGYNYWLGQANAGMNTSEMGRNFLAALVGVLDEQAAG